jgi:multidrug efflux pump subunit AcrA (membrane-fusion protein)
MKKFFQKAFFLPLIIAFAVGLVVYKVKNKPPIEHQKLQFPVKAVNVITLKKIPYRAHAVAYGTVEPQVLLKAKSEVSGKISYIHPQLKQGGSLPKGTLVLKIEPTTFKFSLDQSKAGLSGSQSSLKQLQIEEKSTWRSMKIAQKNLEVEKKELQRIQKIWDKRLIARSTLDKEQQKVLQLQQQVEDLKGKLGSYASRKQAISAQIKQSRTKVEQTQDTLGRTAIRLPFDARIGKVFVEKGEFTPAGAVVFEALGTDAVEINAQLSMRQFRPLLSNLRHKKVSLNDPAKFQKVLNKIDLEARVQLVDLPNKNTYWKGKLLRISESIDPVRDTIGLVVLVDKPYEGVIPGERPPLLKGMYSAISFYAPPQKMLLIPRQAMHQGRVYVAKDDNTLEIRAVSVLFQQGRFIVLKDGLKDGERIIISDVVPVIEGLPLKPITASDFEQQFALEALGQTVSNARQGNAQ